VTEGALVGQGTATLLTTVEQLDPIYVNFDQPAVEVERLRRQQSSGDISLVEPHKAVVQLTLPDGSAYGQSGLLDFYDVAVEPTTGAIALRGLIPNTEKRLLPGMYVNVRLTVGTLNHGFLIPQAALLRDAKGPYVLTVGNDSKVAQKRVMADTTSGQNWIIPQGLNDGDRVIVSGTQNARPESLVNAVPYVSPDGSPAAASTETESSPDPPPPPPAHKRASVQGVGSLPQAARQ